MGRDEAQGESRAFGTCVMKLIEAYQALVHLGVPVFTTADAAGSLQLSNAHASKTLERLADAQQIVRLTKGKWVIHSRIDPLSVVELLTQPWPSYISLQTALFYHGLIEQIPEVIYIVSLARPRVYQTPLGTFSIHQIAPEFFFGFEQMGASGIKMACPEKALLDVFYLTPTKSRLFSALPELELPQNFNSKKAFAMQKRIPALRRRQMVGRRLQECLAEIQGNSLCT